MNRLEANLFCSLCLWIVVVHNLFSLWKKVCFFWSMHVRVPYNLQGMEDGIA